MARWVSIRPSVVNSYYFATTQGLSLDGNNRFERTVEEVRHGTEKHG
jgi:hypothetical protein